MRWAVALISLMAATAVAAPNATDGQGQPTFRTRTAGVRVDVLVTRAGQPVRGLTVKDFVLLDSGVPQAVQSVDLEEMPLHVILALDTSASVAGSRLDSLIKRVTGAARRTEGQRRRYAAHVPAAARAADPEVARSGCRPCRAR